MTQRKVITLEGFSIDLDSLNPQETILKYVVKHKYIIPKIVEIEVNCAPSTASNLLKRMSTEGSLKDLGKITVEKGHIKGRCHLYTLP